MNRDLNKTYKNTSQTRAINWLSFKCRRFKCQVRRNVYWQRNTEQQFAVDCSCLVSKKIMLSFLNCDVIYFSQLLIFGVAGPIRLLVGKHTCKQIQGLDRIKMY